MPELPEVETVRRQLEEEVQGRTITKVHVRFAGKLNLPAEEFCRIAEGAKILHVRRRAKLLMIDLANGITLLVHLKMSGRLLLVAAGATPTKHTHVIFVIDNGHELHFEDTRKFGYVHAVPTSEIPKIIAAKYGPEPLDPMFTAAQFTQQIRSLPKRKIKPHLLDQQIIAGVGNIYADESCHRAGILPTRIVATLSDDELVALYDALREILEASIGRRGTSADMFVDLFGNAGNNLSALQVYGRGGQHCFRCDAVIVKNRLAGRGTHYCMGCQK